MDAMLARGDSSIYPLESKPPLLQTRSGTKCPSVTVMSELQQEDKSRKTIGLCTEKKLMQIAEANYENGERYSVSNCVHYRTNDCISSELCR